MGIIESLEVYISSQKVVALNFAALGFLFSLVAGALWYFDLGSKLLQGLKAGLLIWGALIVIGGAVYYSFCLKTHSQLLNSYQANAETYKVAEHQRIEKVRKDYPVYQMAFALFIMISLSCIIFANKPFWSGVAFSTMFLFSLLMLFEAYSKISIDRYYEQMENIQAPQ